MYFECRRTVDVKQRNDISFGRTIPSSMRKILVRHAMLTETSQGNPESDSIIHDVLVLGEHIFYIVVDEFLRSSNRQQFTEMIAKILTKMRVPEFEQPFIIDLIFTGVKLADHPKWPITCYILESTTFYESIYDKLKVYQLEAFEKVKIDRLVNSDIKKECVICKECLGYFEGVEEGIDNVQQMIVRLSCSHLFHQDCIFPWLVNSPLCPVCRYSLPVMVEANPTNEQDMEEANPTVEQGMEEVAEPTGSSRRQLRWPMLLVVSAGGILTGLAVCRILKQRQV